MRHRHAIPALAGLLLAYASHAADQGLPDLHVNQIGYLPDLPKVAVVHAPGGDSSFTVVKDPSGEVAFSGFGTKMLYWASADDSVRRYDFSALTTPGTYRLKIPGRGVSYPFRISRDVFVPITKGAIRSYYYQRASTALTATYAGAYARAAGHPDNAVLVHNSAATARRPANSKISSPKGWYDAGDYGKYIVNSGITVWTLLDTYLQSPAFFDTLNLNIPESQNRLPDLLDEALWNIDWMLTMQDLDGGVYHKLTTAGFSGFVMPAEDKATRYVVQKGTAATLDFAAVMAMTSRIFRKYPTQRPGFADSCLNAALRAWNWAQANPAIAYDQSKLTNPEITTGTYGDGTFSDEKLWAAVELTLATRRDSFWVSVFPTGKFTGGKTVPGWPSVGALGLMSAFGSIDSLIGLVDTTGMQSILKTLASEATSRKATSPYGIPVKAGDLYWGSTAVTGNVCLGALHWYGISRDTLYRNAALAGLDWILGRNAVGVSFVTGFGTVTPQNPHHRPSGGDGIDAPIPGFVVGGPNGNQDDATSCESSGASYPYSTDYPALSWLDNKCSYASNEVAINWNAPLVAVLGSLQAGELDGWVSDAVAPRRIARSNNGGLVFARTSNGIALSSRDGSDLQEVQVLDLSGRTLMHAAPNTPSWSTSARPQGLFLVRARTPHGWSTASATGL